MNEKTQAPSWAHYMSLIRQLEQTQNAENARNHDETQITRRLEAGLHTLTERLQHQHAQLTSAKHQLRLSHLKTPAVPPPTVATPDDAIRLAFTRADDADRQLRQTIELAYRPIFLPNATTLQRNTIIYICAAAAMLIPQWALALYAGTILWSLIALPAIALLGGYIATDYAAKPRLTPPRPSWQINQPPTKTRHGHRLGAVICYAPFPATWIVAAPFLTT